MNTEDRNHDIVLSYNGMEKIGSIASRHGLSEQTVLSIVRTARANGLVTRQPRVSPRSEIDPNRDERMAEMYLAGSTLTSIGDYFDLTRERVRQILKKNGVVRRSAAEHAVASRERSIGQYAAQIDALFDEMRSIPKVVNEMKRYGVPARWVEQHLHPRRNECLRTHVVPQIWTNDAILEVLREASQGKGTVTIPSYQKWRKEGALVNGKRPPTHSIIAWRFGSWRNALASAGLANNPARRTYTRRWTKEDALRAVAIYVNQMNELGKRPTFNGYDIWSRSIEDVPSGAYIRLLTGMSWSQVLRSVTAKNFISSPS